jgi:hypothetical protein
MHDMSLQQSNSEYQGLSREGALPARVRSNVDALLNECAAVVSFLQERKEELVTGQYGELYDSLRNWGQSRPDLFECLGYLMVGSEQFADDIEADFGKEALGNVAEIQDRFISSRPAIRKVQAEQTYGLYKPLDRNTHRPPKQGGRRFTHRCRRRLWTSSMGSAVPYHRVRSDA